MDDDIKQEAKRQYEIDKEKRNLESKDNHCMSTICIIGLIIIALIVLVSFIV